MSFKKRQNHYASGKVTDLFSSTAREKSAIQFVQDKAEYLIKDVVPTATELQQVLLQQGLPVLVSNMNWRVQWALALAGSQGGFISPHLPHYTLLVSVLKPLFSSEQRALSFEKGFVVPRAGEKFIFELCYGLYHALAFQHGLAGYQAESLRLYHTFTTRFGQQLHPKFLKKLTPQGNLSLRQAVRREKDAVLFLQKIYTEIFVPSNNAKHLDSGQALA